MTFNMTEGDLKKCTDQTTRLMSNLQAKGPIAGVCWAPMTQTGINFVMHSQQKEGQMDEWITIQSKKAKKDEKKQWKCILISINIWFV
jgi:hypothetical protein